MVCAPLNVMLRRKHSYFVLSQLTCRAGYLSPVPPQLWNLFYYVGDSMIIKVGKTIFFWSFNTRWPLYYFCKTLSKFPIVNPPIGSKYAREKPILKLAFTVSKMFNHTTPSILVSAGSADTTANKICSARVTDSYRDIELSPSTFPVRPRRSSRNRFRRLCCQIVKSRWLHLFFFFIYIEKTSKKKNK